MTTSKNNTFDVAIIGGGLIGLATARELLLRDPQKRIIVLEKESQIVQHQSGHNSGVIHSGVYYEPGSEKAILCRRGYHKMINFCQNHNIPYNKCGKLIVAVNENEANRLNQIYQNGKANGLKELRFLDTSEIQNKEQNIYGLKALFVPDTAVVNYKKVGHKLLKEILRMNGKIRLNFEVSRFTMNSGNITISSSKESITSRKIINCAGLYSDRIAKLSGADINHRIIPFRGEYYTVETNNDTWINSLIYPVPDPQYPFLGIHFTKSIDGCIEAGPNAVLAHSIEGYLGSPVSWKEFFSTLTYRGFLQFASRNLKYGFTEYFNSKSKRRYIQKAKIMMPKLKPHHLTKSRSGVRAQACARDGQLIQDFLFIHQDSILHVCNAPSPAATSSLAIAERIVDEIKFDL